MVFYMESMGVPAQCHPPTACQKMVKKPLYRILYKRVIFSFIIGFSILKLQKPCLSMNSATFYLDTCHREWPDSALSQIIQCFDLFHSASCKYVFSQVLIVALLALSKLRFFFSFFPQGYLWLLNKAFVVFIRQECVSCLK